MNIIQLYIHIINTKQIKIVIIIDEVNLKIKKNYGRAFLVVRLRKLIFEQIYSDTLNKYIYG